LAFHLEDFQLSPVNTSLMFMVFGGCYCLFNPIWGVLCDRCQPKMVTVGGAVLMILAVSLMGPAPFLQLQKSLPLILVGLVFIGK
jgi:predicted MFS family arabinose efflux permease